MTQVSKMPGSMGIPLPSVTSRRWRMTSRHLRVLVTSVTVFMIASRSHDTRDTRLSSPACQCHCTWDTWEADLHGQSHRAECRSHHRPGNLAVVRRSPYRLHMVS